MDPIAFLELMEKTWESHCDQMMTIRSIFLYLDRTHIVQTPNLRSVWDMGLVLFRSQLEAYQQVLQKLVNGLLQLIEAERNGESINKSQMYKLLRMLSALQIYHDKFETPFLAATGQFYQSEGDRLVELNTVPAYLLHAETRLREESDRVVHYLEEDTKRPLIHTVEQKLLQSHISIMLEKGVDMLLEQDRRSDLSRMYHLLARVDGLKQLKVAVSMYIRKKVADIVGDLQQENRMVERLLHFKETVDHFMKESFHSDPAYVNMLKESKEQAINTRESRPAELVAKYIDSKLRTGNKVGSDVEVDQLLDRIMVIFRYIEGKDTFEAFYKKALAKRLLLGKSASYDLERSMISKLKKECGNSFTSKLEGMFKDVELSKSVRTQFQEHSESRNQLEQLGRKIEMIVQVLTTVYWPAYVPMKVHFPTELAPYQKVFEDFYQAKFQGRQLQWQHSLGHCVLKARFPKGIKELNVSLFQTLVLLCFNQSDELSFDQLKESTGIENGELCRTLQSLACGMIRVIKKVPKGRDINPTDKFIFNESFTNERLRIKINSIQLKETVKENKETHERVFQDRQYQVDAAVVRIMKARKQLSHNLLMTELFGQLKFPARPVDIKKRIESLIDREYLERDDNSPQVYNYLA